MLRLFVHTDSLGVCASGPMSKNQPILSKAPVEITLSNEKNMRFRSLLEDGCKIRPAKMSGGKLA